MDQLTTLAKTTARLIWAGLCSVFRLAPGWSGTFSLHAVIAIGIIGIPSCSHRDTKPVVIPIEMLPVGTIDNLPQEQKAPPPPPQPKPDTPKQAPEPPNPQPVVEPEPEPEPIEAEPAPEAVEQKAESPVQRIRNKPKPPPKPKPKKKEPPKPKKVEKKPEPKKEPPKERRRPSKQDQEELDNMLNDFLDESKEAKKGQKNPQPAKLSDTQEKALLRYMENELTRNWTNPFAGRQGVEAIPLKIHLNPDGSLSRETEINDLTAKSRYNSDPTFRAMADSAKRAVLRAAPFKQLPQQYSEFYGTQWTYLEIDFDPNKKQF